MQRAADFESYARNPRGRFRAGRSWVHFCAHDALFGIVFFGRPTRADTTALVRSLRVELRHDVPRHRSLVDARRLEGVDASAFAAIHEYVRIHHAALREKVERLALVRPGGMAGALVAGFFGVLEPPYPVRVFDAPDPALEWLDEPRARIAQLDDLVREVTGVSPLVGELRALLATRLTGLDVDAACRALAVSSRTLQRRLGEAGTSFQKELMSARVREAQRRLIDTHDSLTAVALDAGFGSLQHFSTQFRKQVGVSPSTWRKRNRKR